MPDQALADQGGLRFPLGGFTVAMIGAYIAFLPLLQILLPIKAAEIAPNEATTLLGELAALGAVAAGVSNFVVGWASDRTRSRFGRRRPWIIAGLIGVVASYAAIWQAHSVLAVLCAMASFQVAFNMMFSPLLALVSDNVTRAKRGWAAALIGLGKPIGTVVGTVVVGGVFLQEGRRFQALAAMVVLAIAPLAFRLRDNPLPASSGRTSGSPKRHAHRWLSSNFILACLSRMLVIMTFTVAQLYLLFYLQAVLPGASLREAERDVTNLAIVFGTVSAATGLMVGRLSDRTGRRKPLVLWSTAAIGVAMAALAAAPSWPTAVAAYALFAAGSGAHGAVEFAMIVDILPSRERAARDLGVLNISNIVPQIVAPLAVTLIVSLHVSTMQWAFGGAAVGAFGGAALIALMRGVR